ncbi:glycosyltransferase [Rhizobium sullae]|uniref:Glycosyltransferase involved in cell wall biosynthesis n=1 Tax=Rhizobium sullae TaxID=50338 RepID=A0A4R3Q9A5_RHISU|nr:glycosyltransferase [Rhizobium sullae]TCU15962.1 glycosyltransferase involved in cell wall biosynthesis [Rhizobium sullae]
MHVLLLGKIPPIQGGVSRSTWFAASDFLESGHSIDVISNANEMGYGFRQMLLSDDKVLDVFSQKGGNVHNCENIPAHSYIPWAPPFVSQLLGSGLASIGRTKPDVIIGWYLEPYGVAASLLGQLDDVPVILRHAGSDLGRLRNIPSLGILYDRCLSQSAAVITGKNPDTEDILKSTGVKENAIIRAKGRALPSSFYSNEEQFDLPAMVDRAEEWFSHYGFETETYRALVAWNRAGLESQDPAVGSYGKIAEVKGTYNLIDALDTLVGRGIKVSYRALWSATPNRFAHAFHYVSQKHNLRGRSILLPPVAPWLVPAFIRSCTAVAFLENRFPISFHTPQVPREVIACATPLILSGEIYEKVYFRSQLVDRINVLRVPDPQNTFELAKGIEDLLGSSELRQCLSHHSRALSRVLEARAPARDPIVEIAEGLVGNERRTAAIA